MVAELRRKWQRFVATTKSWIESAIEHRQTILFQVQDKKDKSSKSSSTKKKSSKDDDEEEEDDDEEEESEAESTGEDSD